jgi:hypothetical protein
LNVKPCRLPDLAAPAASHEQSVDLSDGLMGVLALTAVPTADGVGDARGREIDEMRADGDVGRGRSAASARDPTRARVRTIIVS